MDPWLKKHATEVTLGCLAVVGGGAYWYYRSKATPAATAATTSTSSSNPTVTLAPGSQTTTVVHGGAVLVSLPTGASWSTTGTPITPLATGATQPSGTQSYSLLTSTAGTYTLTANWTDSTGAAQQTTFTVVAS
jgi:hypothetical protein